MNNSVKNSSHLGGNMTDDNLDDFAGFMAGFLGLNPVADDDALSPAYEGMKARIEAEHFRASVQVLLKVNKEHPELGLEPDLKAMLDDYRNKRFEEVFERLRAMAEKAKPYASEKLETPA